MEILKKIIRILVVPVVVVLFTTLLLLTKNTVFPALTNFKTGFFACPIPYEYKIGQVDNGFHITKDEFRDSVHAAIQNWEKDYDKKLFIENNNADFTINLIYDERQKDTDTLKTISTEIQNEKDAIYVEQNNYNILVTKYNAAKTDYTKLLADYTQLLNAYNAKVQAANAKGGATQEEFDALAAEKQALQTQEKVVEQKRTDVNAFATLVNTKSADLKTKYSKVNGTVELYNDSGNSIKQEFEQGLFTRDENGRRIDIFQYENKKNLTGVLTHEIGHALGLGHSTDETSIMYYLHGSDGSQDITRSDILNIDILCGSDSNNRIAKQMERVRLTMLSLLEKIGISRSIFTIKQQPVPESQQ